MYFGKRYQNATEDESLHDERRSILRRHLIYYLRVWDVEQEALLGHVVDITTDGLMLISEQQIPTQKIYDLEIRWVTPDGEQQNIRLKAESRWSSNDINPSFYDTGFQLIKPDEKTLAPIQEMIKKYGFGD